MKQKTMMLCLILAIVSFVGMAGCTDTGADISSLEEQLAEKQAEIVALEAELDTRLNVTKQLETSLEQQETSAGELEEDLAEERAAFAELEIELTEATQRLTELEGSLSGMSPIEVQLVQVTSHDESITGATVSIGIINSSSTARDFSMSLVIDGSDVETAGISLEPGASGQLEFYIDRDISIVSVTASGATGTIMASTQTKLPDGFIIEKKLVNEDASKTTYEITYVSDGLRVKGYLSYPKSRGPHPAIILNRGGNRDYGTLTYFMLENYAMRGYVTVGSQYRGNAGGQGQEEFGGADLNDILNLIPLLKRLPEVDADRIGMVGISRGGMMTYITLRHQTMTGTDDIKVAAVIEGLVDLFMSIEERPDMLASVYEPLIGGTPSEIPEAYEARSATYWADEINVPLLIQHGDQDENVSVDQALRLSEELDKYGKTYELKIYSGWAHDLLDNWTAWEDRFDWLARHL